MQVLKFGGTSVANAQSMGQCADIISKAVSKDRTIVIASAISGFTDALIRVGNLAADKDKSYKDILDEFKERHHTIIRELLPMEKVEESIEACDGIFEILNSVAYGVYLLGELSPASLDAIQGCGELVSSRILATKMASLGVPTKWIDSTSIIRTHNVAGKEVVDMELSYENVGKMIENNPITMLFVAPGFIASDQKGRMVTLGRGGSDFSASIYAVGSKARSLETWKDVPGIMTADPKIVPDARLVKHISYKAALELSHFGAKVIYPPTIQPVVKARIPILVKCTFDPDGEGTVIEQNPPMTDQHTIGISNSNNIALISLEGSGMVGVPGMAARMFRALSDNDIDIILITQASSVNTVLVAVDEKDAAKAKDVADRAFAYDISLGKVTPLKVETGYSIVCLVGNDMLGHSGTTGRMMAALGRRGVTVRAVAQGSSDRNISVIVASSEVKSAIRFIHTEFFEKSQYKDINLFIAGYGTVGQAFIDILARNRDKIAERTGKRLHLAGLSNSRRFILDKEGLSLENIEEQLANGRSAANEAYFEELAKTSLQNSVFVDITASSDISYKYLNLFKSGYSVVASNKITFAAPYKQYQELKQAAVKAGVSLKYETTVGAALPILESVARSVNSGDEIQKIEAVLSGTLNYIFSTYCGGEDGKTFHDIVKFAKEAGYSEPDPRLDLSGRDVLRKLLIISREAGVAVNEADVQIDPILGPEFFEGKVPEFFAKLAENEEKFAASYKEAASKGLRQRFIASLEKTDSGYRASMGLKTVGPEHPLYNLCGTNNSAIITTEFYPSPLVVQGAGAGAYQTASGVLNDILI
ncbi:MAG: bifunctional aspartate kinase/homoserine dehydrogenase I [Bacteroidales bacterium]|nr:bifunctional aspartate kinase/homoserine dehydrogenase I [Bacteroidales bacterium]